MKYKDLQHLMDSDDLVKAIVEDREEDVRTGRTSKWTATRPGNGFYIERLDVNAGLRDAPVPTHACQNHAVDGHCTQCGEKLA